MTAHQGHLYEHGGRKVIALESGAGTIKVLELDPNGPLGIGRSYVARADWLKPLPMKYFNGEIPQ